MIAKLRSSDSTRNYYNLLCKGCRGKLFSLIYSDRTNSFLPKCSNCARPGKKNSIPVKYPDKIRKRFKLGDLNA